MRGTRHVLRGIVSTSLMEPMVCLLRVCAGLEKRMRRGWREGAQWARCCSLSRTSCPPKLRLYALQISH